MPADRLLAEEIYDAATRSDVVRLQQEFPGQDLETCYYWYLYHHCDYEITKARFANGLSNPFSGPTLLPDARPLETKNVDLGVFPAEIWQIISTHLTFDGLSNLRLTNSALADIAAESIVETVRFDLSFESLERLRSIAAHDHLRIGVKSLVFEASLLAPVGCIHSYSAHYDLEHHSDYKPQPPPEDESTPQAQRLYARNLAKFNKDLEVKYAKYRKSFESQEQLLNGPKEHLFECIDRFPNLQRVTLATDGCRHLLSDRFIERFVQDCAVPVYIDASQTHWELQNILRPGIKRLVARNLSPKFFNGEAGRSKQWLQSVFQNLDHLSLNVINDNLHGSQISASMLETANLPYAIGCAKNIEALSIGFSTVLPIGQLHDIMPRNHTFVNLHSLDIEFFTTTEEDLMEMLKLQPALRTLDLSDVTLSTGQWRTLFKSMRDDLNLITFNSGGTLEDSTIELFTDTYSIEAWQDHSMLSLSFAIDLYITDEDYGCRSVYGDNDDEEFEECWNPVNRVEDGDFASYEDLVEELGPLDEELEEDTDDEFDGLPDLADRVVDPEISHGNEDDDMDSDSDSNESMHTANEAMSENGDGLRNDTDLDEDGLDDAPSPMHVD